MDLVEFPKFPELPGEIRQETFTFCLPQRTLGVYDCRTKIRLRGYMLIIAQVCKEAQAVAATAVQSDPASLFCPKDTWYSWSRSDTASMAPLLFNVQNDILWVGWEFMVLRRPLGAKLNGYVTSLPTCYVVQALRWLCLPSASSMLS